MNNKADVLEQLDKVQYLDMHIHLEDYNPEDLSDNILYMAVAVNRDTYNKTLKLASEKGNVIPCLGIHPANCSEMIPEHLLSQMLSRSALAGEMGLDYHWVKDSSTYPLQREVFSKQLELCKKWNVIPSIHTKGAEKEILKLLKDFEIARSIIHWYSGPEELIEEFLELGCYFTIGPDICTGSQVYKQVPLDRMFAETDNPTGIPWILEGYHSAGDIVIVYKKLSELFSLDEKILIDQFKENLKILLS